MRKSGVKKGKQRDLKPKLEKLPKKEREALLRLWLIERRRMDVPGAMGVIEARKVWTRRDFSMMLERLELTLKDEEQSLEMLKAVPFMPLALIHQERLQLLENDIQRVVLTLRMIAYGMINDNALSRNEITRIIKQRALQKSMEDVLVKAILGDFSSKEKLNKAMENIWKDYGMNIKRALEKKQAKNFYELLRKFIGKVIENVASRGLVTPRDIIQFVANKIEKEVKYLSEKDWEKLHEMARRAIERGEDQNYIW